MTRRAVAARLVAALLVAVLGAVGTALLAQAAVGTARGQRLDQLVLAAGRGDASPMSRLVSPVLGTVTVPVLVIALVVAAGMAVAQRRAALVVHLVVLVAGAAATTQVLKHVVITRTTLASDLDVTPNSFPSGHATIAAAVAVALTLAAPRHVRSGVALVAAAWTAIAGIGTIADGWHRPSDVLGALLVVGAWTGAVLAVDAALALRRAPDGPDPDRVETHRASVAGIAALGAVAVVGLAVGALALASVPTPLDLDDPAAQAAAYRASWLILGGLSAALITVTLALHVPALPRGRESGRVR